MNKNLKKIAIIGHVGEGRSALHHALINRISMLPASYEVELIQANDPDTYRHLLAEKTSLEYRPDPKAFTVPEIQVPEFYQGPSSRRERRAAERRNTKT